MFNFLSIFRHPWWQPAGPASHRAMYRLRRYAQALAHARGRQTQDQAQQWSPNSNTRPAVEVSLRPTLIHDRIEE
jgi:hypothetical protein